MLSGCGIADAIRDLKALSEIGIDDGASEGAAKSIMVSPDQAATLELDTGAKLAVPAGAVDEAIELSMKRPADDEAIALIKTVDASDKVASAPYVLTPHGTTFKQSVEVTLPVADGRDARKLAVVWLEDENDTSWELLGIPDVSGSEAKIALDHFSVLLLVEQGDGPGIGADGNEPDLGGDGDDSVRPGTGSEDPSFDAGVGPTPGTDGPGTSDGGIRLPPDVECVSTFSCKTTSYQCGYEVDNCGFEHDILAECSEIPGCGELGQCNQAQGGPAICGPCTPYASCEEALTAAFQSCNPAVPNGCGGTMDCSQVCGADEACLYIEDSSSDSGGYFSCETPCTIDADCPWPYEGTCYDSTSVYVGGSWCEVGGYCTGNVGVADCPGITSDPESVCVAGSCQ